MSTPLKVLTGIAVLFVVGAIALMTLFTRIPPWHYGVKQHLIAKEIAEVDSTTGFVLRIPGVHTWHMIDRRTHFVTFADVDRDSSLGRTRPSLVFRTKDNNTVTYDLTVTYKVKDGEAHMLVREGNAKRYKELVVGSIESTMRSELAQLSSEEVFSTDQRIKVGNDALPALGEALEAGEDAVSLRGDREEVTAELQVARAERLERAGVEVVEARLSHLAYAPEIASAMLQRQQAQAIIAARRQIVEGAVGMVQDALHMLKESDIVELDDERRATMVGNLLVVLCGQESAQPVLNAGALYN